MNVIFAKILLKKGRKTITRRDLINDGFDCEIFVNEIRFIDSIRLKKKNYVVYIFKQQYDNLKDMFSGCSLLSTINLTNYNTDNINDVSNMFSNCSSLLSINLSKFNTSKVSSMAWMFSGCISLKEIDISNFNFKNLGRVSFMFSNCTGLKNIVFNSNFNINDYIANNTFKGCSGELQDKMRKYFKNINEQAFFSHNFA